MLRIIKKCLYLTFVCTLVSYLWTWWAIAPVLIIWGLATPSLSRALISSFVGAFALWLGWPMILHYTGHGVLAQRMAQLFSLPWWPLLFVLSGTIGGVIGLLSAWFGHSLRVVLFRRGAR